ncbi:MAG: hypothetical protein ACI9Y1_003215 [Lentisphaeria bacterium]
MIVPAERLTIDAIRAVVESYISREGTDYGEFESSFEENVDQLMPKVISGEVAIVYDEESETVSLMVKADALKVSKP